ncbi:MAG: hotdog domain-containing protein [Gammaproteobacteria bacterium]|jgi:acyl-CoA thioesterase FadM
MTDKTYFQQYLPGDHCFGCGPRNEHGLQIKSYWDGDIAKCNWQPQPFHGGWSQLTCGGVIATIVDCHCIATAMATAYRNENRPLNSEPRYLFATGSINIRYLKPASVNEAIELQAQVINIKYDKKYTLHCDALVNGEKVADAQVIALLVWRSDRPEEAADGFKI